MQTDNSGHSSLNRVDISSEGVEPPSWSGRLADFAETILEHLDLRECELSILLTDNETIRRLNREYRGIDSATDVLSFGQEGEGALPPDTPKSLGDIVISLPYVQNQANEVGVPEEEELRRMVVHGVLHLAGHEHGEESMDTKDRSPMLTLQEQILEEFSRERLF